MPTLRNNSEGGANGAAVTTGNTGGSSGNAFDTVSILGSSAINFSTEQAMHGTRSLKIVTNATDAQYVEWLTTASASAAFRAYVYLPSLPTSANGLIQLRTAGGGTVLANILVTNGNVQVQNSGGTTIATTTTTLPTGQWLRLEAAITNGNASTGTFKMDWYVGDSTSAIAAQSVSLTGQNFGTSNIGRIRIGRTAAFGTFAAFYIDDIAFQDGTTTYLGPASNVAPTVSAGSTQSVAPGATVNLAATATDSDGSIASIAWTFDYPSSGAPALTGGTTLTPSFTAGAAGAFYMLRVTVTDDGGATATATVEVRVPAAGNTEARPLAQAATGLGTWTRTGGTTDGGVLADESDATYLESASVSGTEQTRRVRLSPTATRSTAQIVLRFGTDAGTASVQVRLYEGTTLRQSWSQASVPTGAADYTFALSAPTIAAITDWGNLSVEVGATT